MNYQQTLNYLYAQLPMFHRVGAVAYKANLDNTVALSKYFGFPEKKFPSIHVAGTNGKGSVSHMLASIFQEAGYKTGLCTSPHLKDFRERIRINGKMITKKYVAEFVSAHKSFFDQIQPSFFELTIAMSFCYFAENNVEMAIIETGLGGRLDSTNIIHPEISVITNIGWDHMNLLGDTLDKIAREKAGIIKGSTPVIVGHCSDETRFVFEEKAADCHSDLYFAEENFLFQPGSKRQIKNTIFLTGDIVSHGENKLKIETPLTATYQYQNICTVAQTLEVIRLQKKYSITNNAIQLGLRNVVKNTGLLGRWQILGSDPLTICDTGHNADGIKAVLENIQNLSIKHLHFVLGMMNDKDLDQILYLLPSDNTTYYFCKPNVPRGLDTEILKKQAQNFGLKGESFENVMQAYVKARQNAGLNDLVFAGGSTFVVAEII